jgi:hypothetical protein
MRQRAIIVLSFAAALAVLLIFSHKPSVHRTSSALYLVPTPANTMPKNLDDTSMTAVRREAESALNHLQMRQHNTQ